MHFEAGGSKTGLQHVKNKKLVELGSETAQSRFIAFSDLFIFIYPVFILYTVNVVHKVLSRVGRYPNFDKLNLTHIFPGYMVLPWLIKKTILQGLEGAAKIIYFTWSASAIPFRNGIVNITYLQQNIETITAKHVQWKTSIFTFSVLSGARNRFTTLSAGSVDPPWWWAYGTSAQVLSGHLDICEKHLAKLDFPQRRGLCLCEWQARNNREPSLLAWCATCYLFSFFSLLRRSCHVMTSHLHCQMLSLNS